MVADTHQKQGETSGVNKYSSLYACQPEGDKCQVNKTCSKSTFMLAGGHYIYCSQYIGAFTPATHSQYDMDYVKFNQPLCQQGLHLIVILQPTRSHKPYSLAHDNHKKEAFETVKAIPLKEILKLKKVFQETALSEKGK